MDFITYYGPQSGQMDVFLARFNAKYDGLIGAVRLGEKGRQNHLPCAWIEPRQAANFLYPLGQYAGEAPLNVTLPSWPADSGTTWDFGDAASATGKSATHTYDKAGAYAIAAKTGDKTFTGRAIVAPRQAPKVAQVRILAGRRAQVTFSEPVQLHQPKIRLESMGDLTNLSLQEEGMVLLADLPGLLSKDDTLVLEGVSDLAQQPNGLTPNRVAVARPAWPSNYDGVLVLRDTSADFFLDPASGECASLEYRSGPADLPQRARRR